MDRLHYTGDRLVFDYRTALNPKREPTETVQCFVCRAVVTPRQQLAPEYVYGRLARIASGQQYPNPIIRTASLSAEVVLGSAT